VQSSTLNVRSKPSPDAPVVEKLDINAVVNEVGREGEFARVVTQAENEGYVAAEFLAHDPLEVDAALAKARGATDPAERLTWAQRAAAIEPNPAVLEVLEGAYRAVGNVEEAERVAAQRRWPQQMWLVAEVGGSLQLDLRAERKSPEGPAGDPLGEGSSLPGTDLVSTASGWLLYDQGPAVRVALANGRRILLDNCDPTPIAVAYVAPGATPGRVAVAFAADPPTSWSQEISQSVAEADAERAATEALGELTGDEVRQHRVRTPEGWFVRVAKGGDAGWAVVDLHVTAVGVKEVGRSSPPGGPQQPLAARDVNGDGVIEVLWATGGCSRNLTRLDGDPLGVFTAPRCCDD
jgi:hypothetical protein